MELLTKEILVAFKKQGDTSKKQAKDIQVIVKFFDPAGSWTWYASEYDPKTEIFFGFVRGLENELGPFGLAELKEYKGPLGLGIERDLYFGKHTLQAVMDERL